jgi:hypothetical protein
MESSSRKITKYLNASYQITNQEALPPSFVVTGWCMSSIKEMIHMGLAGGPSSLEEEKVLSIYYNYCLQC